MRVASWNLKYCGMEGALRRTEFLNRLDRDLLALYEVSRRAWDVITECGIAKSSAYALKVLETMPLGKRPHGAALLLARNDFRLSDPKLILGHPKAKPALVARPWARASRDNAFI